MKSKLKRENAKERRRPHSHKNKPKSSVIKRNIKNHEILTRLKEEAEQNQ